MRMTIRSIAFLLALTLGTTTWYALGHKGMPVERSQEPVETAVVKTEAVGSSEPQATTIQSLSFGQVGPLPGYANAESLVLRREPSENAPRVATVKTSVGAPLDILDARRDFLLVRFPATGAQTDEASNTSSHEGWAKWDSVIPYISAIVLDAETGAVVGRVPLDHLHTSVMYSPDGSHAIFPTQEYSEGPALAYEVRTSDYTFTRSVVSTGSQVMRPVFYSPNGALSAFARGSADAQAKLKINSLSGMDYLNEPTEISAAATGFFISPDGQTGFIHHPQEGRHPEAALDVVDLRTLKIRQTIYLSGAQLRAPEGLISNRDGSELYLNPADEDSITIIDTWTGQTTRTLRKNLPPNTWAYFAQESLVGDSFLIHYWGPAEDEMHSQATVAWLNSAGLTPAAHGIHSAMEAGGARFAVNEQGTQLLRLDASNHVRDRLPIDRPELQRRRDAGHELTTLGIAARPDGKQVIVFIGVQDGC